MKLPAAGRLLGLYAAFVVYGSLVPLAFTPLPWPQAWAAFAAIPFLELGVESRADWVANGVLYLPMGWLAALVLVQRGFVPALACTLAWAGCALLALTVEFAQLHFPPRTVSQNDLLAEMLGSVLGALLAPLSMPWLRRAWAVQTRAGLAGRLLQLYALGYAALCFFPFDLLVSVAELEAKARSGNWGWLVADGGFSVGLKLLVEVALTAPLGLLLARWRGPLGVAPVTALALGALLGIVIELGQFFIASGVSQGASVLTRAVGVALGVWLAHKRAAGPLPLRPVLRRFAPWWAPAWLLLLLAANGLLTRSWHGAASAAAAWRDVQLLPFYYHYYTTEALALVSLGSVFLMYLPLALLGWARGWRNRVVVAAAALLALAVEAAKLFVDGLHPDPTNVLIAAAAVVAGLRLLALWLAQRPPAPAASPMPAVLGQTVNPLLVLGLTVGVTGALFFPLAPAALLAGLAACAALTWRWPLLPLALLPAALPLLDLAPWSGRFFWDEFDLLCAVCLAVAWQRTRGALAARRPRWVGLAFGALGFSLFASSLRALWPWPGLDDNSFNNYHSVFNALRIVKGAVWAALFVALWRRLHARGADRGRAFGAGMVAGLALTVAVVLIERATFVGLADFAADYRVTGLISAMHKGGAYIECWLAAAAAFAVAGALRTRDSVLRIAAALLLAGTAYAMVVTYSRMGYAALAAVVLVVVLSTVLARRHGRVTRRSNRPPGALLPGALLLAVMVAAALPALTGPFARDRLATSAQDLALRQAHWQDGLQLRDSSWTTTLLGLGLGRYPQAHFWRSREPVRAATYGLGRDAQVPYLRLGTGATLYIEQIVTGDAAPGPLTLSLRLRAAQAAADPASLQVTLCEKWTLTSRSCFAAEARVPAAAAGWQTATVLLRLPESPPDEERLPAPLKLSLLTPALAAVDVADVRMTSASGEALLANGDFARGMDRWFFATDAVRPWQLDSLPLTVLVEQGWLGVLAWAAVLAAALASAVRLAWQGRAEVLAAPAALVGFLVCGSLNTLIDAPRFVWLLLVLAWLCTRASRPAREPVPAESRPVPAP